MLPPPAPEEVALLCWPFPVVLSWTQGRGRPGRAMEPLRVLSFHKNEADVARVEK